ncbi:hypothetical protein [Paracoccus sp. S1E-3]|uniref:hypothetical protein n=1 Tax=Paracoccus sp. S1E-3 TaxID=2756130 RepID=UPI0015EFD464|nr:hypothetical protein [Paracoccus sp. S1E-3]MBA4491586.1 hypothetical protein [Paracoccus sp. S1E-3]
MDDAAGRDCKEMSSGLRLSRVAELIDAIHACHPDDAEHVLSVILEEWQTGAPMPPLLDAMDDAEFWANTATFEDLRAVFLAAGQKLARYPLGPHGRIRMIHRLMAGLSDDKRQEISCAISAERDQG